MNNHSNAPTVNLSHAGLWASAFVILALVIVQAGRLPGNAAYAHMVADRGEYTLMTADSGKGGDSEPDEILCVIDSREQILLVYEVEDARRGIVTIRDGYPLNDLFTRARR
jgi:hypothetical protein